MHVGQCLHEMRRDAEAVDAFRQAAALDRVSVAATLALGRLLLEQRQPAEALDALRLHTAAAAAAAADRDDDGGGMAGASPTSLRACGVQLPEGHELGGGADVRIAALHGCALSLGGDAAAAVRLLLPVARVCLDQLLRQQQQSSATPRFLKRASSLRAVNATQHSPARARRRQSACASTSAAARQQADGDGGDGGGRRCL